MNPTLTEAQREEKAEQTLNAMADRVQETRTLEDEAQHLLGLNDFLSDQVSARRDAGEWIRPEELRRFIIDALARRFPASRMESNPGDEDYFHLKLCSAAQLSLQEFLDSQDPVGKARGLLNTLTLFLSNPANLKARRGGTELIDAGHLLMRWLRQAVDIDGIQPHAVCAARTDSGTCGLSPGLYIFAVHAHKLVGLRRESTLESCAPGHPGRRITSARHGWSRRCARRRSRASPSSPTPDEVAVCASWPARRTDPVTHRRLLTASRNSGRRTIVSATSEPRRPSRFATVA